MAFFEIAVDQDFIDYSFETEFDDVVFTMFFKFNQREDFWYFDLLDEDQVAIRYGIKVTTGIPLLQRISDSNRPEGDILALDTTGNGIDASRSNLGTVVKLLYSGDS